MLDFILIATLLVACGIFFVLFYILPIAWLLSDSRKRGHSLGIVFLLMWFAGIFAIPIWLIIRDKKLSEKSVTDYDTPEDALFAANRLDQLGDWDEAIELYNLSADRWPDHKDYINANILKIKEKQALASSFRGDFKYHFIYQQIKTR